MSGIHVDIRSQRAGICTKAFLTNATVPRHTCLVYCIVTITDLTDGITVSGIGSRHRSTRSAMLTLWFPGLMNDGGSANAFARITVCCHLVDGLKPKLLIGTDVICGEGFTLDFKHGIAKIGSCNQLTFPITAQAKPRRITRAVVYAKQRSSSTYVLGLKTCHVLTQAPGNGSQPTFSLNRHVLTRFKLTVLTLWWT